MNPMSNKPKITRDDIINGYVTRYFCKYTSTGVITEIDAKQYYKIRKDPYYQTVTLRWEILGVDVDTVTSDGNILRGTQHKNQVILDFYEKKMPGLKDIIRSPLEYFNGTRKPSEDFIVPQTLFINNQVQLSTVTSSAEPEVIPPLITDGLRVHYDFANTASYSGTGLTLNDISGYGNNTSFSASPGCTFGTEFGGHLTFLGTPDPGLSQSTISLSALNTAPFWAANPTMTLDYWVKFTSAVAGAQALLGSTSATGAGRFTFLAQTIAPSYTAAQLYVTKGQIINTAVFNNTHTVPVGSAVNAVNVVLTKTGFTYELYINGQFKQSIVDGNSTTYNTGNHNIGNDWNPGTVSGERALSKFKGRLYTFRVYNKVLTSEEVLQNYNSQKARFGL